MKLVLHNKSSMHAYQAQRDLAHNLLSCIHHQFSHLQVSNQHI